MIISTVYGHRVIFAKKGKKRKVKTFYNKQLILKETLHIMKTLLQHSNTPLIIMSGRKLHFKCNEIHSTRSFEASDSIWVQSEYSWTNWFCTHSEESWPTPYFNATTDILWYMLKVTTVTLLWPKKRWKIKAEQKHGKWNDDNRADRLQQSIWCVLQWCAYFHLTFSVHQILIY